jgi:hypothetical protein
MSGNLAAQIKERASTIDSSATSTTKWHPIANLLAEAIGLEPEDLYVFTVSKPGNLKPKSEQPGSTDAKVLVGMYTGNPNEMEQTVESAEKRCKERGLPVLIFDNHGGGFALEVVVKLAGTAMMPTLAAEYPTVSIIEC